MIVMNVVKHLVNGWADPEVMEFSTVCMRSSVEKFAGSKADRANMPKILSNTL